MAAALSVALVPRTVHAVVATLVQIVPGATTHIGQNESRLVSLTCNLSQSTCVAIDSTGVQGSTNYVVPAGYTLVITDYEWNQEVGGTAGREVCDQLAVLIDGFPQTLTLTCTTAGATGLGYRADHFTTGIRLASGLSVFDVGANNGQAIAFIQGYLVPN